MAKEIKRGVQGSPITLILNFYRNGALLNPFNIQDVDILDSSLSVIATITPVMVSTGKYSVTWNIPAAQATGSYFHQWTWQATSALGTKTQKYRFEVISSTIVAPTPTTRCTNLGIGYWGRSPSARVQCEQIPAKIKALLGDKLLTLGKDVFLWQQVTLATPNVVDCSCVKDTTERADITCSSCYGTELIPGYTKFDHETIFSASISSGTTLTNTVLDTTIKPNRILLATSQTTGTFESGAIAYSNPISANWGVQVDSADIKSTNSVATEFSTDNVNFFPISQINDGGKKPIGTGSIYIRITLTRVNVIDRSPEFEIIRLRHANSVEPFIKILRPQISEFPSWMQYGFRTENIGERFWTMPLDFFDSSITPDTEDAKIFENAFYERVTGINIGVRFVTTKLFYEEEFKTFSYQSFETRRVQPEEIYARLVF
jgi:hypothetical protein